MRISKNFAKFSFVSLTTISGGTEDRINFGLIVAHICPSVKYFYVFSQFFIHS